MGAGPLTTLIFAIQIMNLSLYNTVNEILYYTNVFLHQRE